MFICLHQYTFVDSFDEGQIDSGYWTRRVETNIDVSEADDAVGLSSVAERVWPQIVGLDGLKGSSSESVPTVSAVAEPSTASTVMSADVTIGMDDAQDVSSILTHLYPRGASVEDGLFYGPQENLDHVLSTDPSLDRREIVHG
jgi:hypothetical protein